ncbi:uncharacterized protein TM35_000092640 [Trypanosoma theileri]|uniref:Nodulin-like domain-containing protein n=1 Tax=Trypanosoma theileri TaxID=67003 RepID=A0A1X0NZU2_9TRYP|nr:uncharacterized protein TM35_000092640 [Trypanosoma theileri]ORC90214.1 hypothetical protein TM35_000092640 [Trypanosoma theileri]
MVPVLTKGHPVTVVTPIPVNPYITCINDRNRFLMLVAGIFTATGISAHYCFGLISDYLKNRYHFGQAELTIISTVGTSSGAFTFPSGVVFDYFGPSAAVGIPCVIGASGFLLMGLAFSSYIEGTVVLFSIFYGIICFGASSMDTGSLMTNILNFPRDRGAVVVLQKTFNGLGSSIMTVWFGSFFSGHYELWSFFTGGILFLFGMIGAVFLRLPPYHLTALQRKKMTEDELISREVTRDIYMTQRPSQRRLAVGYVVLTILTVFLTTQSLVVAYVDVSKERRIILGSITTLIFLCITFIALPLRCLDAPIANTNVCIRDTSSISSLATARDTPNAMPKPSVGRCEDNVMPCESGGITDELLQQKQQEQSPQRRSYASTLPGPPPERFPEPQYQGSFLTDLLFLDTWLLFWTGFCNWGTGNLIVANTAQIYRSMNENHFVETTNTLYVTLIGVGSALGRVLMGCIEMAIEKRAYPSSQQFSQTLSPLLQPHARSKLHVIMVYPFPSVLMSMGLILLLVIPVEGVVVPLVLISFAFGYSWACTALVVRSLFAKDVGKHYSFLFMASFCANIALNRFMFGELFDREGRKMGLYPFCAGRQCVRTSFLILLSLNLSAIVASVIVCFRFLRYAARQAPHLLDDYINCDDEIA